MREWLSVPQAARYLGISDTKMRGLIKSRQIEYRDLNAGTDKRPHYQISVDALARYERGEAQPKTRRTRRKAPEAVSYRRVWG